MNDLDNLYEKDFSVWARYNAELLEQGRFSELDIPHLLRELTEMGNTERHELENRIVVILAHLLKWEYQSKRLSETWRELKLDNWRATLIEQRNRINSRLKKSPGLTTILDGTITQVYPEAVEIAAQEAELTTNAFPASCPYTQSQILDNGYYPRKFPKTTRKGGPLWKSLHVK